MIKPKDVPTNQRFMGSVFQNRECETILRNVIIQQNKANPEAWTPFTWEDYCAAMTHNVTTSEMGVLKCFVNGGAPVVFTSARLDAGWLSWNEETGAFSMTEKMLEMIERDFCNHETV